MQCEDHLLSYVSACWSVSAVGELHSFGQPCEASRSLALPHALHHQPAAAQAAQLTSADLL